MSMPNVNPAAYGIERGAIVSGRGLTPDQIKEINAQISLAMQQAEDLAQEQEAEEDETEYFLTDYGRQVLAEMRADNPLPVGADWFNEHDYGTLEAFTPPTFDPNDPEQAFQAIFDEAEELINRKQRDYGVGNIESFGTAGVLVRLSDKLARLKNLTSKEQSPATDESLEDTWLDVINYGVIGLCLLRGWVYHPLKDYILKERD